MTKLAPALDAALTYAAHGLKPFPIKPRSKAPATAHGFKDATLDGGRLQRMFIAAGVDANVGIATGEGLLVVELDSHDMQSWFEANDVPATWVAVSGGGGRHFYFRVDRPVKTTPLGPIAGLPDEGSRVKGEGGYVVAPPSVHPDGPLYGWYTGGPGDGVIAPAPIWLLSLLDAPSAAARANLPIDADEVISVSQDEHGARQAAMLAAKGLSKAEARAALEAMIATRFASGWAGLDPSRPWSTSDVERWLTGAYAKFFDPSAAKVAAADERLEARVRAKGKVPTDIGYRTKPMDRVLPHRVDPVIVGEDEIISVAASEVEAKAVRWLWKGRLPAGMLVILDGDPGNGKSSIVADWMARVTTGRDWPDGEHVAAGGAVYVQAEDPEEEVVIPRLRAAGADLSRVRLVRGVRTAKGERELYLPGDIPILTRLVDAYKARLLVFDPVFSYLDPHVNANSDMEVRQALTPLAKMLAGTGCCGVMLRHLKKDDKVSVAMYRGGGSIAIVALARAGFAVHKMKGQEGALALSPTKANLAKKPRSIAYTLEDVALDDGAIPTSRVAWGDALDADVDVELTAFGGDREKPRDVAKELLMELLSDGPRPSLEVEKATSERGIVLSTLKRAKKDLDIRSRLVNEHWWNALPEHQTELDRVGAVRGPDGRLYAAGGHEGKKLTPSLQSDPELLISDGENVSLGLDTETVGVEVHISSSESHSSSSESHEVHISDIARVRACARCGEDAGQIRRGGRTYCAACGAAVA